MPYSDPAFCQPGVGKRGGLTDKKGLFKIATNKEAGMLKWRDIARCTSTAMEMTQSQVDGTVTFRSANPLCDELSIATNAMSAQHTPGLE